MIVLNDVIENALREEREYADLIDRQVESGEITAERASVLLSNIVTRMWRLINSHKNLSHVTDRWVGEGEIELMVECEVDEDGEDVSFWAYQQNGRPVDVTDFVFAVSPNDAEAVIDAVMEDMDPNEMRYPDKREEA